MPNIGCDIVASAGSISLVRRPISPAPLTTPVRECSCRKTGSSVSVRPIAPKMSPGQRHWPATRLRPTAYTVMRSNAIVDAALQALATGRTTSVDEVPPTALHTGHQ